MNNHEDSKIVEDVTHLEPRHMFEIIRREGESELSRPTKSLIWSGIAAGIMISFSVIGEAIFRTYLPDTRASYLIENLGYCFGFLLVILGKLQLFTENTITTIFPLVRDPKPRMFGRVARLWSSVLLANVVGAFAAGMGMVSTPAIPSDILPAVTSLSEHALGFPPMEAFARAIPAGILVAAMVWMLPQAESASFWVIVAFTWLIAAGDFTHIVAGSVEMWFLLLSGGVGVWDALTSFFIPVFAGNVIGGSAIFTLMAWGQVQDEVSGQRN